MSVGSISVPDPAFLCAQNEISLLKEIRRLPQRRKFLAAKKFPAGRKGRNMRASEGFFSSGWSGRAFRTGLARRRDSGLRADASSRLVRQAWGVRRQNVGGKAGCVTFCLSRPSRESRISGRACRGGGMRDSRDAVSDVLLICHIVIPGFRSPPARRRG